MTTEHNYLERSHTPYSWIPLALTYLIVATITIVVVVGISLVGEPGEEIVSGLLFATDIPGLDVSAVVNVTEWKAQPRSVQSIRFVRLVPVPDHPESRAKAPSEVYSLGREDQHGSALPASYCPVFSESDLMRRLVSRYGGIIFYTIYR